MLLKWKHGHNIFRIQTCFCLNFGNYEQDLTIPQIILTPWSKNKLNPNPSSCFIVIVRGKYLTHLGDVMTKLNDVTNDVGGTRPLAIFLKSNQNIYLDTTIWQLTTFLVI